MKIMNAAGHEKAAPGCIFCVIAAHAASSNAASSIANFPAWCYTPIDEAMEFA
jgi:hypothetical protein